VAVRQSSEDQHWSLLVDRLVDEFGDRVEPSFVRRVAAEELAAFEIARVRDLIPVFVWRRSRARLLKAVEDAPARSRQIEQVGRSAS